MQRWEPFGMLQGLMDESGIFDDAPLGEWLENVYNEYDGKL